MLHNLPAFTARWRAGALSDAAYAGVYFLLWQIERHGGRFASRRSKRDPRPDAQAWLADIEQAPSQELPHLLGDWFQRYQFQGVIPNVPAALYHWLTGAWPLRLLERIPAPRDVLRMQAAGARPVTVFSEFPRMTQPVLGKADAFAFMIHDLEHAYKLLHEPSLYQGQMAFFACLRDCLDGFQPYLEDTAFAAKFDYLISDMNTHPAHSLQYLQAILLDWHLRREGKAANDRVSTPAWAAIERLLEDSGLRAAADLREPACRT
ncbi:hypothetical protein [Methyloterricola oryzae]|uniref:hypothetical protein n=1 Tax=Methyloterricola oryzae TaxID=1495050 RepID=UPI00069B347A|nr:hypothetical protein [Methyloterricola oryzae]